MSRLAMTQPFRSFPLAPALVLVVASLGACADEDLGADSVRSVEEPIVGSGQRPDFVSPLNFDGPFGFYSQVLYCEPGTYVGGFRLKVEPKQGDGDDTALNAIALRCYEQDGDYLETLIPGEGPYGSWSQSGVKCSGAGNYVKGARIRIERPQHGGDDTGANDVQLACRFGGTLSETNGLDYGDWSEWQFCPVGSFVCGMSVKIEPSQGSGDDTSLNGMALGCCQL